MSDPIILLDLECGFTHGDPLLIDTVVGRDSINASESGMLRVVKCPDERTVEETVIDRAKTNWIRTTRRIQEPPAVDERLDG